MPFIAFYGVGELVKISRVFGEKVACECGDFSGVWCDLFYFKKQI